MDRNTWLRLVNPDPRSINFCYQDLFIVVFCGRCRRMMKCPFGSYDPHAWPKWSILIRRFQNCEHCGGRNRVSRGYERVVWDGAELDADPRLEAREY